MELDCFFFIRFNDRNFIMYDAINQQPQMKAGEIIEVSMRTVFIFYYYLNLPEVKVLEYIGRDNMYIRF